MAAPKFTSGERMNVYRSLFLLNRSFHLIVQRLDDLKTLFTPQDMKDMRGLTQEMQLEINHLLLNKLDSIEEHDWSQFGKVRIALEKKLKTPPRAKPH
jgi:hypothetical protein